MCVVCVVRYCAPSSQQGQRPFEEGRLRRDLPEGAQSAKVYKGKEDTHDVGIVDPTKNQVCDVPAQSRCE